MKIVEAKEYLIERLDVMSSQFKNYKFSYYYDAFDHFIKITPGNFHEDEQFINSEINLLEDFYKSFPNESVCFVDFKQMKLVSNMKLVKKYK